jgi:cation transport regulator ChaB
MKTKKVTLTEFKEIVKNIIREESEKKPGKPKIDKDIAKQMTINKINDNYKSKLSKSAKQIVDENIEVFNEIYEKFKKKSDAGEDVSNTNIAVRVAGKLNATGKLK